ncbi:PspC domain-containing protein [Geodermatophilus ruber]|uniref:Phage shock protein C (PspC) family protein n=1 Tax=Geodermatophilus ruber TaxID=504800 RepID=A0A1I3YFM4_9ACTN|nr:PspC domain-containing protein [Geodermatophilus ruber]SFK30658.1 phage shock protein C (PspC) family protein [Geodermatophilus ruber]
MTSAPPPAPPSPDPPATAYPPPPGPPERSPLRRSRTDKVIGGVSGGLAEYSGIDALLWRVGFVALALAGPGVPVYLLLWIFMPAGTTGAGEHERRAARWAGPRSAVPGLTLAGLLIAVGLLAALTRLTGWDVGPVGFFGTALLVVGLGLVAAAFSGGRRAKGGLIALGVVLSVALLASTADWRHVDGDVGDRTYRPLTAADVRPSYDGGVGDVTLDLSDLDDLGALDHPVTTRLDAGVGDVEVLLPRSADVRITVDSGIGDVDILDGSSDGGFFPGRGASWSDDSREEIVLTIDAGIGNVEVDRG